MYLFIIFSRPPFAVRRQSFYRIMLFWWRLYNMKWRNAHNTEWRKGGKWPQMLKDEMSPLILKNKIKMTNNIEFKK